MEPPVGASRKGRTDPRFLFKVHHWQMRGAGDYAQITIKNDLRNLGRGTGVHRILFAEQKEFAEGMARAVEEILTPEQLAEIEANGWVIVHREPTEEMARAFLGRSFAEQVPFAEGYHRVIAASVRIRARRTTG